MAKMITTKTTRTEPSSLESVTWFEDLAKRGRRLLEDGHVEQFNMNPKNPTSAKNATTPEPI